jgi:hypothetical protein
VPATDAIAVKAVGGNPARLARYTAVSEDRYSLSASRSTASPRTVVAPPGVSVASRLGEVVCANAEYTRTPAPTVEAYSRPRWCAIARCGNVSPRSNRSSRANSDSASAEASYRRITSLPRPSPGSVSSCTPMNSSRPLADHASADGPSGPPSSASQGARATISAAVIVRSSPSRASRTSTKFSYASAAAYHPENAAAAMDTVSSSPDTG